MGSGGSSHDEPAGGTSLEALAVTDKDYTWIETKMKRTIRKHKSGDVKDYNIIKIEKISNIRLWKVYEQRMREITDENNGVANERWLFHGTNKAQVIVATGFDVKHANPNGMFGAGLYFAQHSSKSNQYVFGGVDGVCLGSPTHTPRRVCPECERTMLISRVCLGKTKKETAAVRYTKAPPGFHSVEGEPDVGLGLKYPEFVIYENDQVSLRYLVTYTVTPDYGARDSSSSSDSSDSSDSIDSINPSYLSDSSNSIDCSNSSNSSDPSHSINPSYLSDSSNSIDCSNSSDPSDSINPSYYEYLSDSSESSYSD